MLVQEYIQKNKSLINIALVGGGNIINAFLGFAFFVAVAKHLDLSDFGRFSLLASLLIALSKFTDFGTNSTYVTKSLSEKTEGVDENSFVSFTLLKFLLLIVIIPISLLFLGYFKLNTVTFGILFIFGLLGYTVNFTLHAYFQRHEKFLLLVFLNLFPALIKGLFAFLIFFNLLSVNLNLAFLVFSLCLSTSFLFIPHIISDLKKISFTFSGLKSPLILFRSSLNAGISQFIYESFPALNNSIVKFIKDFSEVGIYSMADKISNIFRLISFGVFTVLLPKSAKNIQNNKSIDFKEMTLLSAGMIGLAVFGIVFAEFFIKLVFGTKFQDSMRLLDILIFSSSFTAIHSFIENYLFVLNKTDLMLKINIIKLVLLVILSLVIVPVMSIYGLAVSNLVSSACGALIAYYYLKQNERKYSLDR